MLMVCDQRRVSIQWVHPLMRSRHTASFEENVGMCPGPDLTQRCGGGISVDAPGRSSREATCLCMGSNPIRSLEKNDGDNNDREGLSNLRTDL